MNDVVAVMMMMVWFVVGILTGWAWRQEFKWAERVGVKPVGYPLATAPANMKQNMRGRLRDLEAALEAMTERVDWLKSAVRDIIAQPSLWEK